MTFYSGPSGATLELVHVDGEKFIRKSITKNHFKLVDQYNWLSSKQDLGIVARVQNPQIGKDYFSYDLKYYKDAKTLAQTTRDDWSQSGQTVVDSLIDSFFQLFYQKPIGESSTELSEIYLHEKLGKKIQQCMLNNSLRELLSYNEIVINGETYPNFFQVWDQLITNRKLISLLSHQKQYDIHGDLTGENILISDSNIILIDPNQENYLSSMALDIAKLYQSFHSGYELMNEVDESAVKIKDNQLRFPVISCANYQKCFNYIRKKVVSEFQLNEREIIFHEAIHYARMLPYKLNQNSKTFPIYYAKLIELLHNVIHEL